MTKGRRPGKPDTKSEVLAAARVEFAASGYGGATIRSIAARASVDPALVMHYFGSKEQLFAASLELPVNPATIIRQIFDEAENDTGETVVRTCSPCGIPTSGAASSSLRCVRPPRADPYTTPFASSYTDRSSTRSLTRSREMMLSCEPRSSLRSLLAFSSADTCCVFPSL